jgi:hypothetical protein
LKADASSGGWRHCSDSEIYAGRAVVETDLALQVIRVAGKDCRREPQR